ncbi:SAF domain-containing protein [Kitasatospora sp. NBC_01300]|uniref:SAF domain-containing protein n=1 Tax=Kitasatospora sp. NBC_01300 TaxID=2903574 RepID=UPI002F9175E3|nr:SAF domain-containing protein [Kitasatospora sp. NBC_01300]
MAPTLTRQRRAPAGDAAKDEKSGPLPVADPGPRRSRRPALVAVGVALAAVAGLTAGYMVDRAGNRVEVIAVARPIPAGKVISADDLKSVSVSMDPALHPVPVGRAHDILGKAAAADLPAGTLVTDDSVRAGQPLRAGKDTVGVLAKVGQLPAQSLQAGDEVQVVSTPGAQEDKASPAARPSTIGAVVLQVGEPDPNGARVVDLAVNPVDSPVVASWAATGRIALVLKARP